MENLTMKQLEERQAAERVELQTQLDKKLLKEYKEKIDVRKKDVKTLSSFIKQTLDSIEKKEGDVSSQHLENLERNVEYIKNSIRTIRKLKCDCKDIRRNIKHRKR